MQHTAAVQAMRMRVFTVRLENRRNLFPPSNLEAPNDGLITTVLIVGDVLYLLLIPAFTDCINSMRVDEGRNKSSRDQNEGTYRSGEGREEPA